MRVETEASLSVQKPLGFLNGQAWKIRRIYGAWIGLLLADLLALELALLLGYATRTVLVEWMGLSNVALNMLLPLAMGLGLFPLGYLSAGLYPGYGLTPVERMRRKIQVSFAVFFLLILWNWFFLRTGWSRGLMILTMGYALVLVPLLSAMAQAIMMRFRLWGIPVLILGAARTGALVARALQREKALGLEPIGFLDDDPEKQGVRVAGIPVLGPLAEAGVFVRQGIQLGILAMPGVGREQLADFVQRLPFPRLILVPDLLDLPSLWVSTRDLGGILGLEIRRGLLLRRNRFIKRLIDYVVGIPLFLAALPLIGFWGLWIRIVSKGPVFYIQERIGYRGRTIRIFKLRTMYPDAEKRLTEYLAQNPEARSEWERYCKLKNDPRVLPGIGRFLRRTSLDELPQLWNVLKGEMSLVGPRPFPRYHLEKFSVDFQQLRLSVLPGLTGLWQVTARSDGDLQVQESLDTYYIRNWSIWLDLYILVRTIGVVWRGKGAY